MGIKRAVSWQWLFQLCAFFLCGMVFLLAPRLALMLLRARGIADIGWAEMAAQPQIAVDHARAIGAWVIPAAMVSSLGIMRDETEFRRGLAKVLAVFVTWGSVTFWLTASSGRYGSFSLYFLGVSSAATAVAHWAFVFGLRSERRSSIDLGSADGRPPLLWVVWLAQAVGLGLGAVLHAFWPATVLRWITRPECFVQQTELARALAVDQVRMASGFIALVALLSVFALMQDRLPVWRAFRHVFAFTLFALAGVLAVNMAAGTLAMIPGLLSLGVSVGVGAANLALGAEESRVTDDDDAEDLEFWTTLDLAVGPMLLLQSLWNRRRATHLMGVGARGEMVVRAGEGVPMNRVFPEGRRFEVTARFANLTLRDDAGIDVRGAALSLTAGDQRVDLLMNTGSFSAARDLLTFAKMVASKALPTRGSRYLVQRDTVLLEGAVAGLRRAPESYSRLYFYSQKVTYWVDTLGERWLVRYRLAPADLGPESGLPDDADAGEVWARARRGDEARPSNYLREELRARVSGEGVRMRLQAQWHEEHLGDTLEWYSPGLDWDADEHPWLDLGEVSLGAPMSDEDTERLTFNPGYNPRSLGTPASSGWRDPRSVADSERRVVWRLGRVRGAIYSAFGLPRFGDVAKRGER